MSGKVVDKQPEGNIDACNALLGLSNHRMKEIGIHFAHPDCLSEAR